MPSLSSQENLINPCFCISLRAGAIIVSVFDILYGTAYIFRFMYVEYLLEDFHEYFPDPIPNPTKKEFMFQMARRGNYISTILLGVIMFLATIYLRYYYVLLALTCYMWLLVKTLLIISFAIFCNALLESGRSHFQRFGYEILFNIFVNLYFMLVIACFVRETRIELNNYRATKPINIARGEHEDYLRNDRETKFNNATTYHFMSPDFYLNTHKDASSHFRYILPDTHVDDTLLQYVVSGSKMEADTESERGDDDEKKSKQAVVTLKPRTMNSLAVDGESKSLLPSEMSISPDFDRDYESDQARFSRSPSMVRFSPMMQGTESGAVSNPNKQITQPVAELEVENLGIPSSASVLNT